MKKSISLISTATCIFLILTSFYVVNKDSEVFENSETKIKTTNLISLMYETEYNSGIYEANNNEWPTSGYKFNETLSKCENGGILSWNKNNNKVVLKGNISDKCYVYFDKTITLADYIKSQYTNGSNGLYYHDSKLDNGAGDNSYRYSGSYESVNNWVCFGSDADNCPDANLYRIIGVFEELNIDTGKTESRVKLIMNDYPGEAVLGKAQDGTRSPYSLFTGQSKPNGNQPAYAWSGSPDTNSNNWLTSTLNTENLNGAYLTKLGDWANKIAITRWKIGGNIPENITFVKGSTTFQNEIVTSATSLIDNKKIGLFYVSDFAFASFPDNWATAVGDYENDTNRNNNWLYRGVDEWTITRRSNDVEVFYAFDRGGVSHWAGNPAASLSVRPTFYLESSITYVSGKGTLDNPFQIN